MQVVSSASSFSSYLTGVVSSVLAKSYESNSIGKRLDIVDSLRSAAGDEPAADDNNSSPSFLSTDTQVNESIAPMIMQADDDLVTAFDTDIDLVHVVWNDNTPGNRDIFLKRDGADFDPSTMNLSDNPGGSDLSAIAVLGRNVYVVWSEDGGIFYKRSTDGGATFGPAINLSNNAGDSFSPAVAAIGSNVYVVWTDNTPGNFEIIYRRSINGGIGFGIILSNLSSNLGASISPAIAVS